MSAAAPGGDPRGGNEPVPSSWAPLARPVFRALWLAAAGSYLGTWIQDVGAAWLMTSLSPSPFMVALVQSATTLPIFFLALPAGALADVLDRRRLLLFTQAWMILAAAILGVLALMDRAGPGTLLALTFLMGIGTALNAPAWQAIIPDLVPGRELGPALALNSIGINAARTIGPAIGGAVVAAAGPGAAFLLNAASFAGVVVVLYRWRHETERTALPAERLLGAMRAGLRFVRHAPELQAVLIRSLVFILFGSSLWALLPSVARFEMGLDASGYGALLGCIGVGAVAGAAVLPRLRRSLSLNVLVAWATGAFAAGLFLVAAAGRPWIAALALAIVGGAWLTLLTSFHASAQSLLPSWVRGRAIAVYLLVFFGGLAAGSAVWGAVAARAGTRPALAVAAAGMLAGLAVTAGRRLVSGEMMNLAPSRHWPAPMVPAETRGDRGPVLVTVEYRVEPARAAEFARAMRDIRRIRMRDGAFRWDLFTDAADPARFLESFFVESWVEHLRQHERLTVADREREGRARAFHAGGAPPVVTHFIARPIPR
ncbi:MAG: MFS transporter [Candidatus Polarisedimenticolia bacterium]